MSSSDVVLYVGLAELKSTFQFCTGSNKVIDLSDNVMRYYVFPDEWTQLNDVSMNILNSKVVANAIATTTSMNQPYEPNKLLVKHDFIRYISNSLFSTPYGADLFKNESDLIADLNDHGGMSSGVLRDISSTLWKCGSNIMGTVSTSQDVSGLYYSNNSMSGPDNICRVLIKTIYENQPSRFTSEANGMTAENQPYYHQSVPFLEGDVIQFAVMIHAQRDQNNLTGVPAIAGRTYNVSLTITENPYLLNPTPTK